MIELLIHDFLLEWPRRGEGFENATFLFCFHLSSCSTSSNKYAAKMASSTNPVVLPRCPRSLKNCAPNQCLFNKMARFARRFCQLRLVRFLPSTLENWTIGNASQSRWCRGRSALQRGILASTVGGNLQAAEPVQA